MTLRIIAGKFKGRLLKTPKRSSTRPTQGILREAVFNICQNEVEGAHFLDLYAGSGAMGFEALSRGGTRTTFIEQNRVAAASIKENMATLGVESESTLIPIDANRAIALLTKQKAQFDIIYIDPPYDIPFDLKSVAPLLASHGVLFFEERHNPKKPHKSLEFPLQFKETRHFGTALLSIFYPKDARKLGPLGPR